MSKKHGIFVLLMCILAMFIVASASATNLNESDVSQYDLNETCSVENNDDVVGVTEDSEIVSSTHTPSGNTFASIQNAIDDANDGDTIILDGNYINPTQITINKKLSIVGINEATLNMGDVSSRVFTITGSGVVCKNVIFIAGHPEQSNGGAIYSKGNDLWIDNCKFISCFCHNGGFGGAIYLSEYVNSTITNSYFEDCASQSGGSIYGNSINCLKLENNTFADGRITDYNGGAICLDMPNYNKKSFLTIINCNFTNLHCEKLNGGAIYLEGNIYSNISNSNFNSCRANNGGALYVGQKGNVKSSDINIEGCNFINNIALIQGGAASFEDVHNLFISNSNFSYSSSESTAGAIRILSTDFVKIKSCNFNNNSGLYAGSIYLYEVFNTELYKCNFSNSHAKIHGGAIHANPFNKLTFDECLFSNCSADHGGAFDINNGENDVIVKDSQFKNCSSKIGGAISAGNIKNFKIGHCIFEENSAITGGAISVWGDTCLKTIDSIFEKNSVDENGGAILVSGNVKLFVQNTIFKRNSASNGGVIASTDDNKDISVDLTDSYLENNHASLYGGACFFRGPLDHKDFHILNLNVVGSTFKNCSSPEGGSILLMCVDGSANIANSSFENGVGEYGGGIDCYDLKMINVDNCSFSNFNVNRQGGGIALDTVDNAKITDSKFINCSANEKGGGIRWFSGNNMTISLCSFKNCSDSSNSGSIWFGSDISNYDVSDCIFDVYPTGVAYYYNTILNVENVSIVSGETGILTVRLYNVNNTLGYKPVTLTLNGKSDTRTTDKNGVVSFTVNNFVYLVNEYTAEISFDGDEINTKASKNVKVNVNSYRGNLEVTQVGKYYHDTSLTFKLTNLKSHEPIPYARFKIAFSNGQEVNLQTDKNGIANYNLDFNSGNYNFTAYVTDANVDVNTIKQNITIHSIRGNIEISQYGRIFKFKLYNPDNGDAFRNIKVNLQFSGVDTVAVKTNDEGIATYNFPESKGTYNLLVTVDGNQYMEFLPAELNNIVINTEYDPSLNDAIYSTIKFGDSIVFDYLKSGSTTLVIVGGSIGSLNVLGHPEAQWTYKNNILTVSNLAVGSYTLHLVTNPFDNYYSNEADLKITVNKVTAIVKASKITVALKKGASWKVTIVDSKTGKPIGGLKLTLKVYTGNKYVTKYVTTNPNGVATYQTNSLTKGSHKVVVSTDHEGYSLNPFTSSIKVIKQKALKFKVKIKNRKDGSTLSITVKHKNKPINGVKIRLYIYSGKKLVKKVTLKSKTTSQLNSKNKKKFKGRCGWGTNKLSAGKHKVVIKPVDTVKYGGSKTVNIKIKKSAKNKKKYARWESLI